MTIATETDRHKLRETYGQGIEALVGVACYINAVKALITIFIESHGQERPRIWEVEFPETGDSHAYLEFEGKIYNMGVTWPNDEYPTYSLETIQAKGGRDVTQRALALMIGGIDELMSGKETNTLVLLGKDSFKTELFISSLLIAYYVYLGHSLAEALKKAGLD